MKGVHSNFQENAQVSVPYCCCEEPGMMLVQCHATTCPVVTCYVHNKQSLVCVQGTEASKDWQGVEACNPGKENISNRSHSLQKGLAAGTQGHYGSRDPKSALTELNVN